MNTPWNCWNAWNKSWKAAPELDSKGCRMFQIIDC